MHTRSHALTPVKASNMKPISKNVSRTLYPLASHKFLQFTKLNSRCHTRCHTLRATIRAEMLVMGVTPLPLPSPVTRILLTSL